MTELYFRAWYIPAGRMFYRGYQKLNHVLLCDDDGTSAGQPRCRATYGDCALMMSTGLRDTQGLEIFEDDIIRITLRSGKSVVAEVRDVPDMHRSRGLHPLQSTLDRMSIAASEIFKLEILGNGYEHPLLLKKAATF